jgi:solute carrier family 25 (mitochondrial phosphate transporter), member 23/24/25/41
MIREVKVDMTASNDETSQLVNNSEAKHFVQSAEKNMIAGGIAGCVGKTLTAPLSRVTILYQVGPLLAQNQQTSKQFRLQTKDSIISTLRLIIRQEGFRSLWKGNFTAVLHRFPYSAINFASFEFCREQLELYTPQVDPTTRRLLAGAFSGATSCILCYPLDIVKTRLTVGLQTAKKNVTMNNGSNNNSNSIISSKILQQILHIAETEGWRGLFSGLPASLAVAVPTFAVSFTVYGRMKEFLLTTQPFAYYCTTLLHTHRQQRQHHLTSPHLNAFGALLAGSVSGVFSALIIFPIDVIRKRMQVAGIMKPTLTSSRENSMFQQIRTIYKQTGIRGFYSGLLAEILKVCPMVAFTFCSFELLKDILDPYFPAS